MRCGSTPDTKFIFNEAVLIDKERFFFRDTGVRKNTYLIITANKFMVQNGLGYRHKIVT